jgi:hypothetical protein
MDLDTLRARWMPTVALTLAVLLTACEASPLSLESTYAPPGDAALAQLVEEEWGSLSAPEDLLFRALDRLGSGEGVGAVAHVVTAGLLSAEAGDLEQTGRSDLAADVDERLGLQWARIAAAVLGPEEVASTLDGVERVISLIEARSPGVAAGERLDRARDGLARAQAAFRTGDGGEALHEGARAADELRGYSAEKRVRAYVAAALELLARARELAGPTPPSEVAEALAKAKGFCDAAETALEAGDLRETVRSAGACIRIATRVITGFSGGVPDEDLADRAAEAVAHAEELLGRAKEKAGDAPPPAVAEALSRARVFLVRAQEALEAGEYREAIRAAHASAAISRRVLASLR